jgi:hypothetical protein
MRCFFLNLGFESVCYRKIFFIRFSSQTQPFESTTSLVSFIKISDWSFHTSLDLHFFSAHMWLSFRCLVGIFSLLALYLTLNCIHQFTLICFILPEFSPVLLVGNLNVANIDTKSSYLKSWPKRGFSGTDLLDNISWFY